MLLTSPDLVLPEKYLLHDLENIFSLLDLDLLLF
jgi:hypothetical protein